MIPQKEILKALEAYHPKKMAIGTICSHSALQIFHGAKREGFRTVGICTEDRRELYESYPLARPDVIIPVKKFSDVLSDRVQSELLAENVVIIPHGSFVEYVGAKNLEDQFRVPVFGNRRSLQWESSRKQVKEWLKKSNCLVPKEFKHPKDIDRICIVKFSGAKGGRGFFLTTSEEDYKRKMQEKIQKRVVSAEEAQHVTIQEFVNGVRYYPHYFSSPFENNGKGRVELLSMDKRLESNVEEIYRILAAGTLQELKINPTYVVTGNAPQTIRESLLPELYGMGRRVHESSKKLFGGIVGPYCIECVVTPELDIYSFEISARIVAGTNLYPEGSFLSAYLFKEPMSTGRRIARELKTAITKKALDQVVY
ncbi:formate--phosphoribosylaminoimidazolecarboxamide ligase [Candidatus Micrarchaeota archaeon]|nr:formate--phosphoribosylaminoimidazolecarboxamide ligase [Candidatus Micrarchaeota archaeon]